MTTDIVTKIGRAGSESGMSRRNFLKIVGATTAAAGVTGCADSSKQAIFANVKGAEDQVPGVAVWYRSTCMQCSAGCGIEVRTREGRAVKVEGNPDHPINRGGLCALGQASLQDLYNPDRVRQPLKREKDAAGNPIFKPIGWIEAYEKVATFLAEKNSKKAFITGELTGAMAELVSSWSSANGVKHVAFESLSASAAARGSELAYGSYGIPKYAFDKADVVVNFGADFLETWVSPCEFARDWAKSRKSAHPVRVFHVEPRLSLTGANADSWFKCAPGSELDLALAILKVLIEKGKGADVAGTARALTAEVDLDQVAVHSGVSRAQILLMADHLARAKHPLAIAGGTAASTEAGTMLHAVTGLINVALGAVGDTVDLGKTRKPMSNAEEMLTLIAGLNKGEYRLLMFDGSNPAFTLPRALGFEFAAQKPTLVVSFSDKLDETSQFADLILPTNTHLESWGDSRPYAGVYSLVQPAMTQVFDTKPLGDILIDFALGMNRPDIADGAKNFKEYLQSSWKKIHASSGSGLSFEKFWQECLEKGGYFKASTSSTTARVDGRLAGMKVPHVAFSTKGVGTDGLVVYPFASIKTFDGRSANSPWMQELPDPMTQVVWDAWAEMHPETAKHHGLAQGDIATLRNDHGEINVPVYITEHVHKGIVAVPLGQGHESFGRYAEQVGGANVMKLVAPTAGAEIPLLSARADVSRSRLKTHLVNVDGSRSQLGRDIARTKVIEPEGAHGHDDHGHHGEPKQMYEQREHPLYRWGMAIDLAACTGCSACVVACNAENNIQMVGKEYVRQGREMSWLKIDRYIEGEGEELTVHFMPMLCQHCGNAPCEPVCPVYATYHNEEGLNSMVYNRCVGTRYCLNNCSYKVRRFNWFEYETPEPLNWQFNPDVLVRGVGVMEKCTFCSQRIVEAKDRAKDLGRPVRDGEVRPACVQSCPTEALVFGDLNDPNSAVSKMSNHSRGYKVLDHHLNTQPAITYLEDVRYKNV